MIRVSTSSTGVQANSVSDWSAVSADGRYVAFLSYAANLVTGDTNAVADIFIKDIQTGATTRVSTSATGAQANAASEKLSISSDGRYVAFRSVAGNLVAGDTSGKWDVFVKDTTTGAIVCASTGGNGDAGWPAISADGNWVTYPSLATNLVSGDTNNQRDIFKADAHTGAVTRVNTDVTSSQANNTNGAPSISGDGRYVVFWSAATNLIVGDTNNTWDIYRKDTLTGQVSRYSTNSSGAQSNGASDYPIHLR